MAAEMMESPEGGIPQVPWDSGVSIRVNVLANLDLLEGTVRQPIRGYSWQLHTQEEKDAVIALRKLAEHSTNPSRADASFDTYAILTLDRMFYDLPSHRKGRPSFLYAIIQRTIQEFTLLRENEASEAERNLRDEEASINETIASLAAKSENHPSKIKALRSEKVQLEASLHDLENAVFTEGGKSAKLSAEAERLEKKSKLIAGKIEGLRIGNEKFIRLKKSRTVADVADLKEDSARFRNDKRVFGDTLLDEKNRELESSVTEKTQEKSTLSEQKKLQSSLQEARERLRVIAKSIEEIKSGVDGASMSVESVVQPSSETKEATINVVARKYKGRLFDRAEDNASQRVSSEREVITSADKKFIWRDEERVCDNLERLLNEYGKGPGHSPGRLRSAKKVLDEISRLKWEGKSELDQDRDLLLFVRKQGIATYGLNHKKSQLHSIYCTAELAYQERCRIEKEQKRSELKSKEEELKDVSASVERLSSRVDQFQRENVGMKKKIAELENKQRELVGKGASSKSEIERLNLEIEEKSQVLLALRRESVQLGMSAHSVHPIQFTKAEAAFVSDQLAKVDTIFAMDEKIERSMREVYEYNSESEFLAARNMALEKEITSDYDEIARNNGMPERLDTANINSLVDRVSRYEERLKRKASEIKASPEEIAAEKAVGAENSQISEVSPEDLHEEPLTDRRSHKPN